MALEGETRRPSRVSIGRSETGPDTDKADRTLEDLGYTPELARNRSVWQVTFMCFILSSVPYGLSTTLYYPLAAGGPANIVWGWVLISFLILCVAVSLAEITSVYPTAGGVYYQTFVLSPLWCRRVASWICGWSYVAGNITITLAVNFGTTLLFVACLDVFEKAPGVGITDDFQAYQTFLIFLAITLLTHAISAFGNKWLPWLEVRGRTCSLSPSGTNDDRADFCHFLDYRRFDRHRRVFVGCCEGRPPLGCLGLWSLRDASRLAGWLVLLYWVVASRLRHFGHWHDRLVSDGIARWDVQYTDQKQSL